MKRIKKNCAFCNKVFYPLCAEVNRGKGLLCSKECRYKRHSQLLMGHKMKPEAKKALIKALTGRAKSKSHKENMSKALLGKYVGENGCNWKGGTHESQGRIFIRISSHPHKHHNGYILNARYVAEQIISRYLTSKEQVHHINFKKNDDRPKNLYIFPTSSEHTTYHQLLKAGKVSLITESNLSDYQ